MKNGTYIKDVFKNKNRVNMILCFSDDKKYFKKIFALILDQYVYI